MHPDGSYLTRRECNLQTKTQVFKRSMCPSSKKGFQLLGKRSGKNKHSHKAWATNHPETSRRPSSNTSPGPSSVQTGQTQTNGRPLRSNDRQYRRLIRWAPGPGWKVHARHGARLSSDDRAIFVSGVCAVVPKHFVREIVTQWGVSFSF